MNLIQMLLFYIKILQFNQKQTNMFRKKYKKKLKHGYTVKKQAGGGTNNQALGGTTRKRKQPTTTAKTTTAKRAKRQEAPSIKKTISTRKQPTRSATKKSK